MQGKIILDRRVGEISPGWHFNQSCMEKRYDEIIQENIIRGSPTCTLDSGPAGVCVTELSHDLWISSVAIVGGGFGLCPRLCWDILTKLG